MRLIISLLALFTVSIQLYSQPGDANAQLKQAIEQLKTQIAELDQQIATARVEDPESVPGLEEQKAMLEQQLEMLEGMVGDGDDGNNDGGDDGFPFDGLDNGLGKGPTFPEEQVERLASLPDGDIDKQELLAFLNDTYNELKEKLPADKIKGALAVIAECTDPEKCALMGVYAYYQGSPSAALLLLTYAASKSPTDNILNNCAAIMNLSGLEDRAIPCLRYVLNHQPNNTTALNNLGQAYAGLGDLDEAMRALGACMGMSASPHPEACATAAYIEAQRGNMEQALDYMEQAMDGGWTAEREQFYGDNKGGRGLPNWSKVSGVDGRNPYIMTGDIVFPAQCRSWKTSADTWAQQQAFADALNAQIAPLEALVAASAGTVLTGPTSWLTHAIGFKLQVISDPYNEEGARALERFLQRQQAIIEQDQQRRAATAAQFEPRIKACRGAQCDQVAYEHCKQREADDDVTFNALADAAEDYRIQRYPKEIDYYNKVIWLIALRSTDDNYLKVEQAVQTVGLLRTCQSYVFSTCDPVGAPDCESINPANPANQAIKAAQDANCPVNLVIPLNVGPAQVLKITMDCTAFKFETGEVLQVAYERNFIKKESTIAVGVGVSAGNPWIVEADAKAMAFVKFDNNNQPVDLGLTAQAGITTQGVNPQIQTGMTISVNSGCQVNPGTVGQVVDLGVYVWN